VPTYAYACTACGHRFDEQQSFTDAALTTCPVCEGRLRKLFSSVGVVFKGSGFYRTDSRRGSSGTSASLPSKSGSTADGGADLSGPASAPSHAAEQTSAATAGSGSGSSSRATDTAASRATDTAASR